MAGISKKKTKNGVKYTITYRDIFGRQHTSGQYDTKKEAEANKYKFQKIKIDSKNLTIGDALNLYIEEVKKRGRAKKTIEFYEGHRDNALKPFLSLKYSKITKADWRDILYQIRDEKSSQAANGCHRTLRAVFKFLKEDEVISDNSFESIKAVEEQPREFNHFEAEEILKLLELCKKIYPQYYALLFMFVGTGMREGEIFGLLKENIDFEKKYIKVCTQYTGGEFKEYTKTKKIRKVFMFPTLADILKEHIEDDKTGSKLVFHNSCGGFLSPSNIRNRFWCKLLEGAGYSRNYARIHDLRGSHGDLNITLGLPVTFAKDRLGHTNETTTLKSYLKTNNSQIEAGLNKLESVFSKCENFVRMDKAKTKSNILMFPSKASKA